VRRGAGPNRLGVLVGELVGVDGGEPGQVVGRGYLAAGPDPVGEHCRPGGLRVATEAAAAIRATTHQALQELRSIVRVLRDDDEPGTAPPQPVAADLPALVAEGSATTSTNADYASRVW
jgi:hypothetical protein